jgi:hypothetical protein
MSLRNYLAKPCEAYQEIKEDFSQEEVQKLYNLLKEIGINQYLLFYRDNLELIRKYISLFPSQRKAKKWMNHPDILLIRFAAIQIWNSTEQLLDDIGEVAYIVDNGSYRSFQTVFALSVAYRFRHWPLFQFPFDGFDNPFA